MLRQLFKPGKLGDLGVGAFELLADDKLRIALRIFGNGVADNFASGIIGIRDTEEDLRLAGIILAEPALERFGGSDVAAFERLEKGNRRREIGFGSTPVQRESARGEPLPEREREAQEREDGENCVGGIQRRTGNRKSGGDASDFCVLDKDNELPLPKLLRLVRMLSRF